MTLITVSDLTKSFRSAKRREGVLGSMRDLLSREYKTVVAVDQISFSVNEGELLGYIGPNGAGKSTSIKMLTGILKPTSGSILVSGFDPFKDRRRYTGIIGVVFGQRTQLWWDIAVIESLRLLGRIYKVDQATFNKRLDDLCAVLEIRELLHTPVRKLSLGQRIRCDLAASLIYGPKILFLDEPTIGLDAVGKDSVRRFLKAINRDFKTTIIMTTHDLKEIEELCNRIMIIDKGKIIFDGALDRIKGLPGLGRKFLIDFAGDAPIQELSQLFYGKAVFDLQGTRRVLGDYDQRKISTPDLVKEIVGRYSIVDLTISEPEIEEVVMKIYREGMGSVV